MKRVALVLAAGMAAACSAGEPGDTAYPLPQGVVAIELPTQPPRPTGMGCVLLALPPVRVEWDASRRVLSVGGAKVIWPNGYTARLLPTSRLEILRPDGVVVARDGDTVQFGGADYQTFCSVA